MRMCSTASTVFTFVSLVLCQLAPAQIVAVDPDAIAGKDTIEGVYVHDSGTAVEKMAHAQRMEGKQWNTAAELYQEIVEKFADRVVPSQVQPGNKEIRQYTSVALAVQERLAKWPVEGLDIYRTMYEPRAEAAVASLEPWDLSGLQRVVSNYFVTDTARTTALSLIDRSIEAGDFSAAAWLGKRLLDLHPNLDQARPSLLFRTSMAMHLAGDDAMAALLLKELQDKHAEAVGTIQGQEQKLSDALAEALSGSVARPAALAADSWPMFGGSPDRGRRSGATGRPGARLYGISYAKVNPQLREIADDFRNRLGQDGFEGQTPVVGVSPSVDRGELFFQDGANIYAVSLESGVPLPGWKETYGGSRNGRYSIDTPISSRSRQLTVTLTNDSVLAVIGQVSMLDIATGVAQAEQAQSRLVCLDRVNGRERWIVQPRQLPEQPETLRQLDFTGSPIVAGDSVYVLGRNGKGQFEDCYVLSFALSDGSFQWASYIASANSVTQGQMMDEFGLRASNAESQLSFSGGRVYVLTNLGAAASLDASSGAIVWLNIYARNVMKNLNPGGRGWNGQARANLQRDLPPGSSPLIVSDGFVFVMPTDSDFILVYEAGSGKEIKRLSRAQLGGANALIWASGEQMLVTGLTSAAQRHGTAYLIDWTKYNAGKFHNDDSCVLSKSETVLPPIRGRAFLIADAMLVPTEKYLARLDLESLMLTDQFPENRAWSETEGRGNVVVAQDFVVIATQNGVDVYTDLILARKKLDTEVAAAPTSPLPRLRYAEIMFAAGEYQESLVRIDEAIELLGGAGNMPPGESRDRVFNDAITFAQQLARQSGNNSLELAGKLYDRAELAASSAAQQVSYLVSRAKFAAAQKRWQESAELYQRVLADTALRAQGYTDIDAPGASVAGEIAENAIERIIRTAGRAAYQKIEQEARQAYESAGGAIDPARLIEVAHTYPNSQVAGKALLTAGDAYEAAGDFRRASAVLRQTYFRQGENADRIAILQSLARNYLQLPGRLDVAIGRLRQIEALGGGSVRLSRPLVLPDGRRFENVSISQAVVDLQAYRALASQPALLPDLQIPSYAERIAQQRATRKVVHPLNGIGAPAVTKDIASIVACQDGFTKNDRLIAFSNDRRLLIFEAGLAQPIARSQPLADKPKGAAWVDGELQVWGEQGVLMLSGRNLETIWSTELASLPPIDPAGAIEPDEASAARDGNLQPQIVVINGQRQRIMVRGGVRGIQIGARAEPANPALATGESIVDVAVVDARVICTTSAGRVFALDQSDGSMVWQARPAEQGITRLVATDDFCAIMVKVGLNTLLCAYDSYSGQSVFRRVHAEDAGVLLVNCGIAPTGMLVGVCADRLFSKDLFESTEQGTDAQPLERAPTEGFSASSGPGNLIVSHDRVIVLAERGKTARVYAFSEATLVPFKSPGGGEVTLSTGASLNTNVLMRRIGSRVYFVTDQSICGYNLDDTEDRWTDTLEFPGIADNAAKAGTTRDQLLTRDWMVAVHELPPRVEETGEQAIPSVLHFYSREVAPREPDHRPAESGVQGYTVEIIEPSGIFAWQAIEGGLAYLTRSSELHWLPGAGSKGQE